MLIFERKQLSRPKCPINRGPLAFGHFWPKVLHEFVWGNISSPRLFAIFVGKLPFTDRAHLWARIQAQYALFQGMLLLFLSESQVMDIFVQKVPLKLRGTQLVQKCTGSGGRWFADSLKQGRTNETLSHPAVRRWFTVALYSFLSKTTFPNWEHAHFWSGSSFWSPGLFPFYPSGYFATFAIFAFQGSNRTFVPFVPQGLNSTFTPFTIFTPWGFLHFLYFKLHGYFCSGASFFWYSGILAKSSTFSIAFLRPVALSCSKAIDSRALWNS